MKVISSVAAWRAVRATDISGRIGFVPTMGALHPGHASLLKRARAENDCVVSSLFVNPTQFNDTEDFNKYPKTWEADLQILEQEHTDYVFAPDPSEMYPDDYLYAVAEKKISLMLEGRHRAGHFDGVLTVVMKLFQILQPQSAYFGEKDHQQLELIRGMAAAFFLPIQIVACPTVRESDGLAMSSRNVRLSAEGRKQAPLLYAALTNASSAAAAQKKLQAEGIAVDYVQDVGQRRYAAITIDQVRLIDNVNLS